MYIPPVYFHVLSIEEEYSCRYQCDVKVLSVHWITVSIHDVDVSHLRHCMLVLGKLR